jgi:hypothetical protein
MPCHRRNAEKKRWIASLAIAQHRTRTHRLCVRRIHSTQTHAGIVLVCTARSKMAAVRAYNTLYTYSVRRSCPHLDFFLNKAKRLAIFID